MTKENQRRQVLLCLAGTTPQIITETLYHLTQKQRERVDEVRVITTLEGKKRIMLDLLDPERGQFVAFCRDYGLDRARIRFDEETIYLLHAPDKSYLRDIRSEEENGSAADDICEIVCELTKDPLTRLHASAAGGRKTMSIYLTAAMQLFGRMHDRLSHVLVGEDFETHPEFYYVPPHPREFTTRRGECVSTADAEIHLADIPFIRLRRVLSGWMAEGGGGRSYGEMVRRAQEDLDFVESEHDLLISLKQKRVTVGRRAVRLTEREMFFYAMFARFRVESEERDGAASLDRLTREDFDRTFRRMTAARGEEVGIEECTSFPRFDFLNEMTRQIGGSRAEDIEEFKKKFLITNARIKSKFERAGLPAHYTVVLCDERGSSRYGLPLAPERIKFV
ncbi:MAG: TIGR02584 family CRISPR-associated protein [Acidobacteria bacterium]|nr:TIGR02584 family CRISPR-associated protein [Acidobacteriota bacterium]